GITRTANVDADAGVAVTSEIVMHGSVTAAHEIALAVGKVFEERRHWPVRRIRGQPHSCGMPRPVGEREPFVLDNPHPTRQLGNSLHGGSFIRKALNRAAPRNHSWAALVGRCF